MHIISIYNIYIYISIWYPRIPSFPTITVIHHGAGISCVGSAVASGPLLAAPRFKIGAYWGVQIKVSPLSLERPFWGRKYPTP